MAKMNFDDILHHRSGVLPYALFSGVCAFAGALVIERTRPHALAFGLAGGVVGAVFEMARTGPALTYSSQQVTNINSRQAQSPPPLKSSREAAMVVLRLLAAQESGHAAPKDVIPALKAFQAVSNLPITGMPDSQTQAALIHAVRGL